MSKVIDVLKEYRQGRLDFRGELLALEAPFGTKLIDCDFSDCDLENYHLSGQFFVHCNFSRANLRDLNGGQMYFEDCDFTDAVLESAYLSNSRFQECNMQGCDAVNAKLDMCWLGACDLSYADFSFGSLERTSLYGTAMTDTNLIETHGIYGVTLPGMSSRGDALFGHIQVRPAGKTLKPFRERLELELHAGCQLLSSEELIARVKRVHRARPEHRRKYLNAIAFLVKEWNVDVHSGRWDYLEQFTQKATRDE